MFRIVWLLPLFFVGGCISNPPPEHPRPLIGLIDGKKNVRLYDGSSQQCELDMVDGRSGSVMTCQNGTSAIVHTVPTVEGDLVGFGEYPDGSRVAIRISRKAPQSLLRDGNPASGLYSSGSATRSSSRGTSYRRYIRGPRGGCYYINSNGNKTYVDHGFCR